MLSEVVVWAELENSGAQGLGGEDTREGADCHISHCCSLCLGLQFHQVARPYISKRSQKSSFQWAFKYR